jgi:hypothetical protein
MGSATFERLIERSWPAGAPDFSGSEEAKQMKQLKTGISRDYSRVVGGGITGLEFPSRRCAHIAMELNTLRLVDAQLSFNSVRHHCRGRLLQGREILPKLSSGEHILPEGHAGIRGLLNSRQKKEIAQFMAAELAGAEDSVLPLNRRSQDSQWRFTSHTVIYEVLLFSQPLLALLIPLFSGMSHVLSGPGAGGSWLQSSVRLADALSWAVFTLCPCVFWLRCGT